MSNNKHKPGMTPSEAQQHAWLEDLPPAERSELEHTWFLASLGREPEPNVKEVSTAWANVAGRLDEESLSKQKPPSTLRLITGTPVFRWAAAMVLLAMTLGYFAWMRPVTLDAAHGETIATTLPDGSEIHLASGSSLSFSRGLRGDQRTVFLKGEAFFDVVSKEIPFIVETFNASIEVLGTRFNVRAREGDIMPQTVIALEEGSVRFSAAQGINEVTLSQGQLSMISYDEAAPTTPKPVDMHRITSWREGKFAFSNHPLSTVLAEIERRYAVKINLADEISDDSLTLFHEHPENVEVLLDAIAAYKGYRYQVTRSGYALIP